MLQKFLGFFLQLLHKWSHCWPGLEKKNVELSSVELLVLPVSETLIAVFGLLAVHTCSCPGSWTEQRMCSPNLSSVLSSSALTLTSSASVCVAAMLLLNTSVSVCVAVVAMETGVIMLTPEHNPNQKMINHEKNLQKCCKSFLDFFLQLLHGLD